MDVVAALGVSNLREMETSLNAVSNSSAQPISDVGGGDLPGDRTSAAVLSLNTVTNGEISSPRDQDWYKVSLTAGHTYHFLLSGSGNQALADAFLTLYNVSSELIVSSSNVTDNNSGAGQDAYITFTPNTSGTYYVAASGFMGAQGSYGIAVREVLDTIAGDQNTTQTLGAGATVTSTFSNPGDVDSFLFNTVAGQAYRFSITGLSVDNLPPAEYVQVSINSINGSQLQTLAWSPNTGANSGAYLYYTATTTGTTLINVSSWNTGGGYQLSATQEVVSDVSNVNSGATSLTLGAPTSGILETSNDVDVYALYLSAGTYTVRTEGFGNFAAAAKTWIYASIGIGIGGTQYSTSRVGSETLFTVFTSGTYYFQTSSQGSGSTGDYKIEVRATPDAPASLSTNTILTVDTPVSGTLSKTDVDYVRIDLQAGKTYVFSLEYPSRDSNSTGLDGLLQLMSSNGDVIASDDNSGYSYEAQIVFTPTVSGSYILAARGGQYISEWMDTPYRLRAEIVSDSVGQSNATSQSIALGASITGTLEYQSDKDWFGFSAEAGHTYYIGVGNGENTALGKAVAVGVVDSNGTYQSLQGTNFTALASGSYYVVVGAADHVALTGTLTYRVTTSLLDTIGTGVMTNGRISVGQTLNGSIDFAGEWNVYGPDADTYAIVLTAGQDYEFTLKGDSSGSTNDLNFVLRNEAGNQIYLPQLNSASQDVIQFHADMTGIYYLEAIGTYGTGGYTLSAAATSDVFDTVSSKTSLTVGSPRTSQIDYAGDKDLFRLDVVAGQSYLISVEKTGSNPLGDPALTLYDQNGNSFAYNDDSGTSQNSLLRYTATTTGTIFVGASDFGSATGEYRISAQAVPNQDPLDTIDWGTKISNPAVKIYFAKSGEKFDANTASRSWTQAEIDAFMAAAGTWANVANLSFSVASSAAEATMVVMVDTTLQSAGMMTTPPSSPAVGVFKPTWGTASITAGGSAWATFVHEVGHALGLAHPHDAGGTSEVMEGVTSPYAYGLYGLNQGVYTVMSYNSGMAWFSINDRQGHEASPMALDIAVVQEKYGTVERNTGDTTYELPTSASGFTAIWDTGGTDTIITSIAGNIDLRPATLLNATGGGGYVSASNFGGFTIAHGVTIENATGSAFNDTLTGNDANNILVGNAGNDVIAGGKGNDTLSGGEGNDTVSFEYASNGVRVDLSRSSAQDTGEGLDTLTGFENVRGSAFDDTVSLTTGDNIAYGGAGNDTLILSGNFSDYTIVEYLWGQQRQFQLTSAAGGVDMVYDFETFQFADRTVSAAKLVNSAPLLYSPTNQLKVDQGGSVVLTTANLTYTDEDNTPDEIVYSIDTSFYGSILVNGQTATRFTHAQLAAGLVSYKHNGNASASADIWFKVADPSGVTQGTVSILYFTVAPGFATRSVGDDGSNEFQPGSGRDYVETRGGSDIVRGGSGDDLLDGGDGDDQLFGDEGDDAIYGGAGFDYIVGGDGKDRLFGAAGADFLIGEAGDDYMEGGSFDDHLYGNDGNDELHGGDGGDRIIGGAGNDLLYGDGGDDVIIADDGEDVIYGGNGYSYLHGGRGNDRITGGDQDDFIVGGGDNDQLWGGDGNDQLYGDTGDDIIFGGNGLDFLIGGEGADMLFGEAGNDVVFAQEGDDIVNGGDGADNLYGQTGNDILEGWAGDDLLLGGDGNDTLYGHTGNDSLYGQHDNDTLYGMEGNDLLSGGDFNDKLYGGDGDDTLYGDAGDDTLSGDAGKDYLIGGTGRDLFVFDRLSGVIDSDIIAGFNVADDSIGLTASVFKGLTARTGSSLLLETQFVTGASATTEAQRVIYDPQTGILYYDADGSGSGAAVEIARFDTRPTLTADDFLLL